MATSTEFGSKNLEAITPLLDGDDNDGLLLHDYVDYKGHPSKRSQSGGWRSAAFIIGAGGLERFAYRGVECNLVNYLTGPLGESVAVAAANVNIWIGLGSLMPIVGGFLADSVLGLHRTNVITSIVYILGLCLSTISVAMISSSTSNDQASTKDPAAPIILQVLFFVSIYLVALTQGFQSSIQVFGADQFDRKHPEENKANSSFFNWWIFGLAIGIILAFLMVPYIQENIGWGIGFGLPFLAMVVGFILLFLGNRTYRFAVVHGDNERSPHEAISSSSQEVEDQEITYSQQAFHNHE